MMHRRVAVLSLLVLAGCIQTREDLKGSEEARKSQPVYNEPSAGRSEASHPVASAADAGEAQEAARHLNGRIEVLEHELQTLKAERTTEQTNAAAREQELQAKIALLTESVAKLEEKMNGGGAAVAPVDAAKAEEAAGAKNPWLQAEEEFKNKNWRQAIVNYQKYRASQPNGKNYAGATYKMAVSFQELGLKQDAKAFFEEVITRFPNTEHAKKAQFRVKQIR